MACPRSFGVFASRNKRGQAALCNHADPGSNEFIRCKSEIAPPQTLVVKNLFVYQGPVTNEFVTTKGFDTVFGGWGIARKRPACL